jgi:hypothetical protein
VGFLSKAYPVRDFPSSGDTLGFKACLDKYLFIALTVTDRRHSMAAKLTLSINPSIIDRAESYAQQRNKTVSKLVEEYLQRITELDIPVQADPFSSPLIDYHNSH